MNAPSAAQLIAAVASSLSVVAAIYATRRGSSDTRDSQKVAHKLEEERDEFARYKELLDAERTGRARDIAYEREYTDRERGRADREHESGEHWHHLYREEQHESALLRNTVRELALVVHNRALATAAIDGVTAADFPPVDDGVTSPVREDQP